MVAVTLRVRKVSKPPPSLAESATPVAVVTGLVGVGTVPVVSGWTQSKLVVQAVPTTLPPTRSGVRDGGGRRDGASLEQGESRTRRTGCALFPLFRQSVTD